MKTTTLHSTTQIIHKSQPRVEVRKTSDGWLFSTKFRGHGGHGHFVKTAEERDAFVKTIKTMLSDASFLRQARKNMAAPTLEERLVTVDSNLGYLEEDLQDMRKEKARLSLKLAAKAARAKAVTQ